MKNVAKLILLMATLTGAPAVAGQDATATFDVDKMTCATCPIAVKKAMERVDGVKEVKVDYESKTAVVTFDPEATTTSAIGQASTDVGFPATVKITE